MSNQTFATAITCIDGRTHLPVRKWIEEHFPVDFVDRVTEPGVDRVLAEGTSTVIAQLRDKVCLSVTAHHSKIVTIVGHHDCAANPVDAAEHRNQIQQALETVSAWNLSATVIGLWLDETWSVEVIDIVEPSRQVAL